MPVFPMPSPVLTHVFATYTTFFDSMRFICVLQSKGISHKEGSLTVWVAQASPSFSSHASTVDFPSFSASMLAIISLALAAVEHIDFVTVDLMIHAS